MNHYELRAKEEELLRQAGEQIALNTDEGDAKHDELVAEANKFGERAAKMEAIAKRTAEIDASDEGRPEVRSIDARAKSETADERELRNYNTFLRGETRAVLQTGGANGEGNLIPRTASDQIIDVMVKSNPLMSVIDVITTPDGATYDIPKGDDTAGTAADLDEGTDAGDTDFAFSKVTFGARLATTGMVQITRSMIQDDKYNLQGYVANKFGVRMGSFLGGRLTTGNGTTQVQGLYTGFTAASRVIDSAANTGLTFKDLMSAEEGVDEHYHTNAVWILNRKTFNVFRAVTDSSNAPVIFQGNYAQGVPNTILGKPYVIVNSLADNVVGFGDFKEAYAMRQVAGLTIATANELYIKKNAIGVIGFMRYDAKVKNEKAAIFLKKKT